MKPDCRPAFLLILTLLVAFPSIGFGQEQEPVPRKVSIGDGVALHVAERGEGEPVIFIHGLTGDYSVWMRQLEAFAGEGFRAIAYSRRYNYPNENTLRLDHSASSESNDLAALIRKLELEDAHIVGHSFGATTALFLALDHPGLVRTLTLAEAPIIPWLVDLQGDQSEGARAQFRKLIDQGSKPAKAAFESGDEELALRTMFDCIGGEGNYEKLPDSIKEQCRRNIKELKALITSRGRPAVDRERVRRLEVPTLILSGSDSVASARFTDPELERLIPEQFRRRVVLPGATHIMWVEQPVQSRQAVLELIRGE